MTEKQSKRTTMADVAKRSGYGLATVSRVINGNGSASAHAVKAVREAAASLGYRPDPALSALASYRARQTTPRTDWNVALVIDPAKKALVHGQGLVGGFESAMQARGYSLIRESFPTDRKSSGAFFRRLKEQGVGACFVIPPEQSVEHFIEAIPEELIIITPTNDSRWDAFNRVAPNHFFNMRMATLRLIERGARKPGLLMTSQRNSFSGTFFSSSFLGVLHEKGLRIGRNILYVDRPKSRVEHWLRDFQPDGIVVVDAFIAASEEWSHLPFWPERVVTIGPKATRWPNLDPCLIEVGRAAARVLDRGIRTQRALRERTITHRLIDGVFQ